MADFGTDLGIFLICPITLKISEFSFILLCIGVIMSTVFSLSDCSLSVLASSKIGDFLMRVSPFYIDMLFSFFIDLWCCFEAQAMSLLCFMAFNRLSSSISVTLLVEMKIGLRRNRSLFTPSMFL